MVLAGEQWVTGRTVLALEAAAGAIGLSLDRAPYAPSVNASEDNLVPVSELIAYCRVLFASPRKDIGLAIGQNIPLDVTGLWGFLLRSSPTYGAMLQRAAKYIRIVNKFPEFAIDERGDYVALVSPHPQPSPFGPRHHLVTATMSHWIAWGRALTGVIFPVDEARFTALEPADMRPYRSFFRGELAFNAQEDAYILKRDILSLPLKESTPELSTEFERLAEALVSRLGPKASFVDDVRAAIGEELISGAASEEKVAKRLGVTARTMHRRLVEDGASFRKVKDELMMRRAEKLLSQQNVTLGEICYLMGYSEPANFNRAFRRWTGLTPNKWRAQFAS